MRMKRLLRLLNPFIWLINQFLYDCHIQSQFHCKVYEPYDFSKDLKYFS